MAELVPWIEARLRGVPDGGAPPRRSPGKVVRRRSVQHLADVELVFGFRGRMVLAEDRPPIAGFDQDRWATLFRYRDASPERAVAQLKVLRTANLALWRTLRRRSWRGSGCTASAARKAWT